MLNAIKDTDYKWCFGKIQVGDIVLNENRQQLQELTGERRVEQFSCISTMSLIKAEVKPEFDESMLRYNDWDLWLRLDKEGHKGLFIDKLILKTKDRPNRISTGTHGTSNVWTKAIMKKHL